MLPRLAEGLTKGEPSSAATDVHEEINGLAWHCAANR